MEKFGLRGLVCLLGVTLSGMALGQDFGRGGWRGDHDRDRGRDRGDRYDIDVRLQQSRIQRGLDATRARQYSNADYEFRSIEIDLVRIDDRMLRQNFEMPLREIRDALMTRGLSDYEIQRRVERNAFELQRQFDRLPNNGGGGGNGGGWGNGPGQNVLERDARDLEDTQRDLQMVRWGRLDEALRRAGDVVDRVQRDVYSAKSRSRFDADLNRAEDALNKAQRTLQDRFMTAESKRSAILDCLMEAARAIRNSDACRNGGGNGGGWGGGPGGGERFETAHVRCDSRDNLRLECPTFIDGNVDVVSARVTIQRSHSDCIFNQSFGLSNGGRTLWVTNGCRGEFDVTYRRYR